MEKLSATLENYLKTIYYLCDHDAIARVSDIAARMGVTKASASNATNLLAHKGLIRKEDYRGLSLTSEGLKQAMLISNKHKIIQRFLREVLSVDPSVADKDACSFEHAISLESLHSMCRYLEDHGKVKTNEKKFIR